jgi:hypothetical protein
MATGFQIDAFQGDGFQIEGGAPAFQVPYYWTMVTTRPVVRDGFGAGFSYAFPVMLGGTEALRRLDVTASVSTAKPATVQALSPGFAFAFPLTLGGTEALRTLRRTSTASQVTKRTATLTPVEVPRM